MQFIIYKQDNGSVALIEPAPEYLQRYTIHQIAKKDVPAGKPYKIVDEFDLPQGVPQEYWVVEESELTDGWGGDSNVFDQD